MGERPRRSAWADALAPLERAAAARIARVAAQAHEAGADRRAHADGVQPSGSSSTGRARPGGKDMEAARAVPQPRLLRRGPRLPARLRAVGRGLPLALPRRGRPDAPRAPAAPSSRAGCTASCLAAARRRADWLAPGIVTDPTDPKLAHLDGLNLSRAWMLEGIAARPARARRARRARCSAAAAVHREKGLAAVTGEHYEGGHWLGTFAVYLVTAAAALADRARPEVTGPVRFHDAIPLRCSRWRSRSPRRRGGRRRAVRSDARDRRQGPRLRPSRRGRQALHARELRQGEGAGARLHGEPLPDGAGLRGPHREARRRLRGPRRRSSCSSRRTTRSRCASTSRARRTSATPSTR